MSALRTQNFRRLWLAGLISDTGDWLLLASLPIVVYQFTGSTLGTAAAFLVELIPPVLFAPLVGPGVYEKQGDERECLQKRHEKRGREFQADESGAHLLHDGEPLARALEKIEAYVKQRPMDINPAQAQAYIVNPLTGRKFEFSGLWSSHPPTAERIQRLRSERF